MAENNKNKLSLNKVSFFMIATVAILYVVGMILSLINAAKLGSVVTILQSIAAAIMIVIVAILAWRYVRNRTTIWKVFYFLCLALVIVGIIVPLVV